MLDKEMKLPSTPERGKHIAEILNHLEIATDAALHFDLNFGFRKISNLKKKIQNGTK